VKNLADREYYLQHNKTQYVPGAPREVFVDLAVALEF
jgi:outer membrane receptor for ferric coprogen and ferric-rhodotorulic acid